MFMKHPIILMVLGFWFIIISLSGVPVGMKKLLITIPALFLIALAITAFRNELSLKNDFSLQNDELIQELAQDIAEDIVHESDVLTSQEVRKLHDIL